MEELKQAIPDMITDVPMSQALVLPIDFSQGIASGGNKPQNGATNSNVFAQATAPTGGYHPGDLWFDTANNNKVYRADETGTWVSVQDGTIGALTLTTSGYIKGGQTAYNVGTGFFLGYESGAYKLSIGTGQTTPTSNYTPGASAIDGFTMRDGGTETWATLIAGAGTSAGTGGYLEILASTTLNQYQRMRRLPILFDTSGLPSDAVITAATLKVYVYTNTNGLLGASSVNSKMVVCASTPASNTALVAADFIQFGAVDFGRSDIQANLTLNAYNNITLNASGRAAVNIGGITKFGLRYAWDFDGLAPHSNGCTWASGATQEIDIRTNALDGVNIPTLTITYTTSQGDKILWTGSALNIFGNVTLGSSNSIKGGQTGYNTGAGFFLGYSGAAYKFSIGDGGNNYLTWDGTTLSYSGQMLKKAGTVLYQSADTSRNANSATYTLKKEILLQQPGTYTIKFTLASSDGIAATYGQIYRNGSAVGTERSTTSGAGTIFSEDISGWSSGDLCQLYTHYANVAQPGACSNFRLYVSQYDHSVVNTD